MTPTPPNFPQHRPGNSPDRLKASETDRWGAHPHVCHSLRLVVVIVRGPVGGGASVIWIMLPSTLAFLHQPRDTTDQVLHRLPHPLSLPLPPPLPLPRRPYSKVPVIFISVRCTVSSHAPVSAFHPIHPVHPVHPPTQCTQCDITTVPRVHPPAPAESLQPHSDMNRLGERNGP